MVADSADEVIDAVAKQAHDRSPEVVAAREGSRRKLLDDFNADRDAERKVFTDAMPSMRAALVEAGASESELRRLGDPFTIDSTTQEFEHATFVRLVSLAAPDAALAKVDMPAREARESDPILAEHYAQMDQMESEYQSMIPRIKAAMSAVEAPEREVDFLTSPWMGTSSTVSIGTPTYIRLCQFVGDRL